MALRSEVECPYCGHIHSRNWFSIDDDFMELICAKCGTEFIAEVEITVITKKYFNDIYKEIKKV